MTRYRFGIAAALVLAVLVVLVGLPDVTHAAEGDTRHCVTGREPFTTPAGLDRAAVERRWDVRGQGIEATMILLGDVWIYPMCDKPFPDNFAFAKFSGRDRLRYKGTAVSSRVLAGS